MLRIVGADEIEQALSMLAEGDAFASSPLAAELHRQHIYRVRFDEILKYPQILEILEEPPPAEETCCMDFKVPIAALLGQG